MSASCRINRSINRSFVCEHSARTAHCHSRRRENKHNSALLSTSACVFSCAVRARAERLVICSRAELPFLLLVPRARATCATLLVVFATLLALCSSGRRLVVTVHAFHPRVATFVFLPVFQEEGSCRFVVPTNPTTRDCRCASQSVARFFTVAAAILLSLFLLFFLSHFRTLWPLVAKNRFITVDAPHASRFSVFPVFRKERNCSFVFPAVSTK